MLVRSLIPINCAKDQIGKRHMLIINKRTETSTIWIYRIRLTQNSQIYVFYQLITVSELHMYISVRIKYNFSQYNIQSWDAGQNHCRKKSTTHLCTSAAQRLKQGMCPQGPRLTLQTTRVWFTKLNMKLNYNTVSKLGRSCYTYIQGKKHI